jgi:O-antigen/teichoic acid export membrane protein
MMVPRGGAYFASESRKHAAVSEARATSGDDHLTSVLDTPHAGQRVIRGMALRIGGYAVGVVLGIISAAVALRHLGVVDSGRLITVLALVTIVGGISDLGLSSLAIREYATLQPLERVDAMRNLLGLRFALAVAGILGATLFAVAADYPAVMVVGTLIASSALLVAVVQQNLAVSLSASLRLGWVTVLTLLGQLGIAVGFVTLSLANARLTAFYVVSAIAAVPVLLLTLSLVWGAIPLRPAWRANVWRQMMRDILPYSLAVVFYVLYFRFAVISVSLLSSEKETGYYAASFRIIDAVTLIPPVLASSAFPLLARAARNDQQRLHSAIGRLSHGMLILGVWIAITLGLGAPIAIRVVAGPAFERAVDPLRIQAVALVGTSLLAVWGYGLLSLKRHRAIMLANALSLVLAGALSIILVPRFGAVGAAISLTVAEFGLAAGCGVALMRSEPGFLRRLAAAPRVLMAAGLALSVPLAFSMGSIASVLLASSVYGVALVALRAVPSELKEAFLNRFTGPPTA